MAEIFVYVPAVSVTSGDLRSLDSIVQKDNIKEMENYRKTQVLNFLCCFEQIYKQLSTPNPNLGSLGKLKNSTTCKFDLQFLKTLR